MRFTLHHFLTIILLIVSTAQSAENATSDFWSFKKPIQPVIPEATQFKDGERVRNAIDAFIYQKLDEEGLQAAPQADKYTLVRRAYFDLLGLPPSPAQIEEFVNNSSEQAWTELINKLLESTHYGERWGRHWLDVARYADSAGFEGDDSYPYAWRYRDYVVSSFNSDKPYNLFVQEQIAGDEIWPDNLDLDPRRVYHASAEQKQHFQARAGTGLYCFGPRVAESALDARRLHYETLTDWADTTGAVFMGLTMGCARCHEHKFDPITQQDYFGLQAIFTSSVETEITLLTPMELEGYYYIYPRIVAVQEAKTAYRLFQQRTKDRKLTADEKEESRRLQEAIVTTVMQLPEKNISTPGTKYDPVTNVPMVRVLGHERTELIKPVHLLERGELALTREKISPAVPAALAQVTGREKGVKGPFGSRKELALWLTQPDHPLTARVMVNRIWHWHFGRGIVATPNDFGKMGGTPSHPELLDYLATEFVDRNWSVKEMHRLIMNSATYQMTSRFSTERHQKIDPDNRCLWRMSRRRLEGEALWDAVHLTAGTINLEMGGRPVVPPLADDEIAALREKWQWPISGDPAMYTRRGLYILQLRNFRFPMFEVFDAPVNSVSCPERAVTTVAPQALWTLNSPSVFQQAIQLAARIVNEVGSQQGDYVERLWMVCLARQMREDEKASALDLLAEFSVEDSETQQIINAAASLPESLAGIPANEASAMVKLCLAVYNLNEFAFVD